MRKRALVTLMLLAALAPHGAAGASPAGPESNPVGSLRWLPANTNEQVPDGLRRLVVIYDRSLNEAGKPSDLLARGAFGLKITATGNLRMSDWSPRISPIDNGLSSLENLHASVVGDVRDGDCSNVGTASFSAAFSTTRTFLHSGTAPYQTQDGPGACEVIETSVATAGGFQTRVTTHVPGFWIDVQLPSGPVAPQVWYTAAFDTDGEFGPFYRTADSAGSSKTITAT
ncbi:MAG: hypothetical protein ACRDH9_03470 [Actinomycetota bacterium]